MPDARRFRHTDLQEVVAAYRQSLPSGKLYLFRVDKLDRIGMPVATAAFFPEIGKPCEGFGYGLSEAEAYTGALGELTEELEADAALRRLPRERGTFLQMRERFQDVAVVDPLQLSLPAGSRYDPVATEIHWLRADRYPDGAGAFIPLDAVAVDEAQVDGATALFTPITNGAGAGLSFDQAVAHGLLELHQRDGNTLAYRALDRGIVVELDRVEDPATRGLLRQLDEAGIEILVKLASTDFEMANLYVVGIDRGDEGFALQATACGEAVHPDREMALRKALTEFVSSRSRKTMRHGPVELLERVAPQDFLSSRLRAADPRKEEQRALRAMLEWTMRSRDELRAMLADSAFRRSETVAFSALPSVPSGSLDEPSARLAWLASRLKAAALTLHVVTFTGPESPVHAVKVIVPGLEAETMSYYRIGRRGIERLRRDWGGRFLLDGPGVGRARIRLSQRDEADLGGPLWLDTRAVDGTTGELYPLYREPSGQAVQAALLQD